jgi:hypothetical protein
MDPRSGPGPRGTARDSVRAEQRPYGAVSVRVKPTQRAVRSSQKALLCVSIRAGKAEAEQFAHIAQAFTLPSTA